MQFEFSVSEVGQLPSAGIVYLNGTIQSSAIKDGDQAKVDGTSDRFVSVKSVAMVDSQSLEPDQLTLTIDMPEFPLSDLEGALLVSAS